ncbi:MAG: patatin [Proteobacteria bacterium]|nr:MAG: patatin [Pseudomonadota bacterium]
MKMAASYDEWEALARQHDLQSGAEKWKGEMQSDLYDYREIAARLGTLRSYLAEGHERELLYSLNEGVHGNMGGMGSPIMYAQTKLGTKNVIDEYVSAIADSMQVIASCPDTIISHTEKLDFFRRASHCYGRSTLLLSGGVGLIFFHHGVVQELIDHDLLPHVISGSSAGAIVSAQLGTMTDSELKSGYFIKKRYTEVFRTRFLNLFLGRLSRQEIYEAKERLLDEIVPRDITFQEAFELTGRYINISISPAEKHQNSRLMNAITSPNVYIRSAVSASFSVPGVVPSERLYAKGFDGNTRPYLENRRWVDGSVSGDLPIKRLSRLYGVNHSIVSQINPFVVPFIDDIKSRNRKGFRKTMTAAGLNMFNEGLIVAEKVLDKGGDMGNILSAQLAFLIRMIEQSYLGDVNIILDNRDFKWRNVFFEFKKGEIEALIHAGRRSTWPKLAMIKNAEIISSKLDRILEELNAATMEREQRSVHHIYN